MISVHTVLYLISAEIYIAHSYMHMPCTHIHDPWQRGLRIDCGIRFITVVYCDRSVKSCSVTPVIQGRMADFSVEKCDFVWKSVKNNLAVTPTELDADKN